MFKSLRRKFVATSVASVAVVIILMASTLNFINYYKMGQRVDDSLYEASKSSALVTIFSDGEEDMIVTKNTASKTPNNNGFSIAKIDENKNVIRSYRDDVLIKGKDDLQKLVTDAVNESSTSGYVGTYRYLKVNNDAGNLVLLLNTQRDLDSFHAFMRNSIIVSSIVILSVFILLVLISKKVIAPIQQSYQKQKQFTDASHELKTPLAIIRSNTDVLELENGDSKWTKNIQNQVDRLTSLVNSLVVFSRMEEKDTAEKVKFNLSESLHARIDDFEELASFQKKHIIADIDNNIYYRGEQQAIVQLMDILLENAIKYATKETNINVTLKKNKKYAMMKISNQANVKKGDLRKVFDRFYRLDESRNSTVKGYGIGLSMAKLIAEKHKEVIKAYAPEDGIFKIEVRFTLDDKR